MSVVGPRTAHQTRAVVRRQVLAPVTASLVAVAVVCAVLALVHVAIPLTVQLVPFAVSIVLFGLPHGALDHLVPARLDPRVSVSGSIVAVVVLYLVLGGATITLWMAVPAAGFALFVLVTWFHWGQGDLWVARAVRGRSSGHLGDALTVLVRGGLPMLVPLVAQPGAYASVLAETTRVVAPGSTESLGVLASPALRAVVALVLAALAAAQLATDARHGGPVAADAAETAVLVVFFAIVPPVLAVGLYFTLWHAVRHIVRLELLDPRSGTALAEGRLLPPLIAFLREAWPTTLAAIALLTALALVTHSSGLGVYLVLIAALTTPHSAVVTWMDRRQYRARAPGRGAVGGRLA